ncbi:MAG TPA: hypothetical protein VJQ52_22920, partial [Steroidobacteraceae bacterium]|nr:hypothetical protein [Steroidobacteraceae bacterium]
AMLLALQAPAAPFDENLKAPRAATSQALRTKLKAHFAAFERKGQEQDPAAFIRDRVTHRQWSDLYFSVKLAMDEGTPLADLAAFGLQAQPDGAYVVDLRKFPQWEPLDSRLYVLRNAEVFQSYVPALLARGFRDEDIKTLRTYLATHDARLATHAAGRQLVDTFAERLVRQQRAGQRPNVQEVLAYRYQKASIKAEAKRQWAVQLLDSLDRQRQRILVSFLQEEFESELTFAAPREALGQTLEKEVQPIVSGDYAKLLDAEAAQIRLDVAARTEKLNQGEQR